MSFLYPIRSWKNFNSVVRLHKKKLSQNLLHHKTICTKNLSVKILHEKLLHEKSIITLFCSIFKKIHHTLLSSKIPEKPKNVTNFWFQFLSSYNQFFFISICYPIYLYPNMSCHKKFLQNKNILCIEKLTLLLNLKFSNCDKIEENSKRKNWRNFFMKNSKLTLT